MLVCCVLVPFGIGLVACSGLWQATYRRYPNGYIRPSIILIWGLVNVLISMSQSALLYSQSLPTYVIIMPTALLWLAYFVVAVPILWRLLQKRIADRAELSRITEAADLWWLAVDLVPDYRRGEEEGGKKENA